MKILFYVGGFPIHLFGLTIATGIIVGFIVMLKEAKRKGLNQDKLMDLGLYSLILGIIGARLNYVLAFNPSYYMQNPKEIFMINQGGLSIQGALILGSIFALWYMRKKQIPIGKTMDAFAPGLILGQAIGRVGCDVFGIAMAKTWFWGINIEGQLLHPVQMYEMILNYVLFLVLWNKRKDVKYDGQLFIIYIIGFSLNRFIVEFFRTNPKIFGSISIAHIFSIITIILGLIIMKILKKKYYSTKENLKKDIVFNNHLSWKSIVIVIIAIIISVTFYYFIHGNLF